MELSQETIAKIDARVEKYPTKRSAALPLLHLVQEEKGYIPDEAIEWIAKRLELNPINIYEIITFYPMLKRKPMGRKHVASVGHSPAPCAADTKSASPFRSSLAANSMKPPQMENFPLSSLNASQVVERPPSLW